MSQLEEKFLKDRKMLNAVYDLLPVGKEVQNLGADAIADTVGINHSTATRSIAVFVELGILSRRLEYGTPANGLTPGRHYHYTLLLDRKEAFLRFDSWVVKERERIAQNRAEGNRLSGEKRRGRKIGPKAKAEETPLLGVITDTTPVAIATSDKEETRAIAGEVDPTLRNAVREAIRNAANGPDQSLALVEAVRQYHGRTKQIETKVRELEKVAAEIGVTIDTSKVMDSMSFKRDPDMELLALLLPYIAVLERKAERLGEQIADQRTKLQGYDQLRTENGRLRAQNERLIGSRSATATAVPAS